MIRFACPNCKQVLQAADSQAGSVITCPRCKAQMKVPQAAAAPASAVRAPASRPGARPASGLPTRPEAVVPTPGPALKAPAPRPAPGAIQAPAASAPVPPRPAPAPAASRSPAVMPGPRPSAVKAPPPPPLPEPVVEEVPSVARVPWWKRALREIALTSAATWGQTVRLTKYSAALLRRRSLRKKVHKAELALGETVYANTRGGDPQLRQQIAALDAKIREAQETKAKTRPFVSERQALLHKMGAFALAQKALPPGVEAERQRAREMHAALSEHEERMKAARVALPPAGARNWLRVATGYAGWAVSASSPCS